MPGYLVEVVRAALPQYRQDYELLNWARLRKATSAPPEPVLLVLGLAGSHAQTLSLHLTSTPISRSPFCFFSLSSALPWRYQGPASLGALRLGVTLGYAFDEAEFQQWLERPDHRTQITRVGGERAVERHVEMLGSRHTDVVLDDRAALRWTAAHRQPPISLRESGCLPEDDQIHIGIPRTDPRGQAVMQNLNRGLAQLRAAGKLQPILARYGLTP